MEMSLEIIVIITVFGHSFLGPLKKENSNVQLYVMCLFWYQKNW